MGDKQLRPPAAAMAVAALMLPGCWGQNFSLDSPAGLEARNVKIEAATYKGRKCVRVTPDAGAGRRGMGGGLAVVTGPEFQDGVIEVDMTGQPGAEAEGDARGFVGVVFRMAADGSKHECFYLRPTNGRAEDQERRNHSTQYVSFPDFEWPKLRKETPGKYESYVDLAAGEWTKVKIEVRGVKARLYVNGAEQPTLLVNDLKLGEARGGVALWIGPGTDAHFANLRISK